MKSATEYPDLAGSPAKIQFLKGRNMDVNEHFDAHRGNMNRGRWFYAKKILFKK